MSTIDLGSTSGPSQQFSSNSSLGSSKRFRYRGRMLAVKAMNHLPPVQENHTQSNARSFSPLNKSRRALYISIAAVLIYLCIGTLTYTLWIPEWNVVDSMYFSMATITTIGYGDIAPMNDGVRAFTLFYIILGFTTIYGILFGFLFDHLYNRFEEISRDAKALTKEYFIERLDNGGPEGVFIDQGEPFWSEFCRSAGGTAPLIVALIVPPLIMGYYEDWNVLQSFYFTVNTATTVGYGDIAPSSTWMRLITVFYIPICMVVMAKSISKMTGVYLRHKAKATEQEYFNRKLTENDFELMDVEGEGHVGYDEFLVFMLVAMGKVNPEDIQKMEELYQRLDAENEGAIKIEDLFTLAYGDIKDS